MLDDTLETRCSDEVSPDDLHALAAELAEDEGLSPVEALSQALALHDQFLTFAALWDLDAALMGNPCVHDIVLALRCTRQQVLIE